MGSSSGAPLPAFFSDGPDGGASASFGVCCPFPFGWRREEKGRRCLSSSGYSVLRRVQA